MLTRTISFAVLAITLAVPLRGQVPADSAGPSIHETLDFIKGFSTSYVQVPSMSVYDHADTYPIRVASTGECSLDLAVDYHYHDFSLHINLHQVDPLSLKKGSNFIWFQTTGGVKSIHWTHIAWKDGMPVAKGNGHDGFDTPEVYLVVASSGELLDRYYRAWKHALFLCAAKVSAF